MSERKARRKDQEVTGTGSELEPLSLKEKEKDTSSKNSVSGKKKVTSSFNDSEVSIDDNSSNNDETLDFKENPKWNENWKKMLKTEKLEVNPKTSIGELTQLQILYYLYHSGRSDVNPNAQLSRMSYNTALAMCGKKHNFGPGRNGGSKRSYNGGGSKRSYNGGGSKRSGSKQSYQKPNGSSFYSMENDD